MIRPALAVPVLAVLAASACVQGDDTFETPTAMEECDPDAAPTSSLRFVSYNIRGGLSSDIDAVGDVVEKLDADVIALQEVHDGVAKSGGADQAQVLADRLGYERVYAASAKKDEGTQGVALLSRFKFRSAERVELDANLQREPRVAIDSTVCNGPEPLRVVATHTDFLPWSAEQNARDLARHLQQTSQDGTVVMGDLNQMPGWAAVLAFLAEGFHDVVGELAEGTTYVRDIMPRRLDYILTDETLREDVTGAGIVDERASDHLPIFVDVERPPPADDDEA